MSKKRTLLKPASGQKTASARSTTFISRLRRMKRWSFLPGSAPGPAALCIVMLLALLSCNNKGASIQVPDIAFDAAKWRVRQEGAYPYRRQMVTDVLKNYQMKGASKDSVIRFLGQPDAFEEGNLRYDYEYSKFLGGLGTKIGAVVVALAADSTVKEVRLNDGGFD